jgi:phosphoglycolate phosphatase
VIIKNFDNFIFDLDGTIIDSALTIQNALEMALIENKIKLKNPFSIDIIGPPVETIVKNLDLNINESKINDIVLSFRNFYDSDPLKNTSLYPNIYQFLNNLKNNGKKIFIATNKSMKPTLIILKGLKIYKVFSDVYSPNKFFKKELLKKEMISEIILKYDLEKTKTVMIGDTLNDVYAAHNNNIKILGFLRGYEKDKINFSISCDYSFNDFNEISF